jgi:DNA-binding CsgD family transcriptional regulator
MSRPAVRCVPEREQRDRSPERNERDAPDSALHFSKAAIEFLNSIPTTHDVLEWIVKFRERLRALLGDVDRISIAVNIDCDLRDSFNHKKVITVTQISDGSKRNAVTTTLYDQSPSRRMRDNLMKMEFPFHCYRDPETFEYFLGRHAYVGAIFLWREKSKSAISRKTLQTMQELESFIVFLLTDIVARHKYSDATVDSQFALSLGGMFSDAKLSEREAQVVTLQLFGHTYDQIADRLSLSINTVRKHVASIHRKTGTHSFTELFAKYFTPSLGF